MIGSIKCCSLYQLGWFFPIAQVSCEPTSQKDADKLGEALNKLAAEDPSFRYSRDEESNQTVIEGMGDWGERLKGDGLYGDGSKPWYLVNPKIAGKWMFIPLNMYL